MIIFGRFWAIKLLEPAAQRVLWVMLSAAGKRASRNTCRTDNIRRNNYESRPVGTGPRHRIGNGIFVMGFKDIYHFML